MALHDRRVLVTGAGGFLGAAVVRRLVELGARVRALLGPAPAADLAPAPPGVAAVYCDLEDPRAFGERSEASLLDEIELVYHLAGPPSVAASFAAPAHYLRVHAAGTAALLERCLPARVPLVYVSSAEVYAAAEGPVAEDAPRAPCSPYGAAKLAAELVIEACAAGAPATIVRPFSVYGPGASPRSVVAELVAAVVRGEAPCVADPRPVRDYCYVTDAADAIVRCGCRGGGGVRAYNVASGRGVSVEELARAVLRAAGRGDLALRRREGDRPPGALVLARIGDPSRARDELGFRAEIALEDGLARTLRARREEART